MSTDGGRSAMQRRSHICNGRLTSGRSPSPSAFRLRISSNASRIAPVIAPILTQPLAVWWNSTL